MNLRPIHIKEYDYPLPEDQIARYPLEQRSASRLLFYQQGLIGHKKFVDLPDLLPAKTMLVFNNTRVIEARLSFKKTTGAEIEVFLLNPADRSNATLALQIFNETVWECMIGNKKRWKEEDILEINRNNFHLKAKWHNRELNQVKFILEENKNFAEYIHELGNLPIPPYLNRQTEDIDLSRYQTSFAEVEGSVAAPTAALHFDEDVKKHLDEKGIVQKFITLHVGAGTFKPVSTENVLEHEMHEEYIVFKRQFIKDLLAHQEPVIPVGTTSLRSLESLYWFGVGLINGSLNEFHITQYFPYQYAGPSISKTESLESILNWMDENNLSTLEGTSAIYIVPAYQSKMVNGIITNFHQPQSTLLLLISALIGNEWKKVYESALQNNYRFLSYGDSSLLLF